MLGEGNGRDVESCFSILRDPDVNSTITMQHVVMSAKTGLIEARQPDLTTG